MDKESLEHGLGVGNITNARSALRLLSASPSGTNVTVSWQRATRVSCFLKHSTNLSAIPPFTPLATGIPGQSGTTTYTDTNSASLSSQDSRTPFLPPTAER